MRRKVAGSKNREKKFEYVGPMIMSDSSGNNDDATSSKSGKAATDQPDQELSQAVATEAAKSITTEQLEDMFVRIENAKSEKRQIVYVSLGTALTGDTMDFGWHGYANTKISGKQLCQSVYRAVFAELGADSVWHDGQTGLGRKLTGLGGKPPLIVVSTGRCLAEAFGTAGTRDDGEHTSSSSSYSSKIVTPENSICLPAVPQQKLLKLARAALVVTHGGQNTFMEALGVGSPLVVCPGFGDQVGNGAKAERFGVGVKVDRPKAAEDDKEDGMATEKAYVAAVRAAIRKVLGAEHEQFLAKAGVVAQDLVGGGGAQRAARICIEVAGLP